MSGALQALFDSTQPVQTLGGRPLDHFGYIGQASQMRTGLVDENGNPYNPDGVSYPQSTYNGPVLLDRVNNYWLGINPSTGKPEPLYDGLMLESDPLRQQSPYNQQTWPMRGPQSDSALDNLAQMGVVGGLGAMAGGAFGSILGGAGGEAVGAGASATDASTGLYAGESATAGSGAYGTSASAGVGAGEGLTGATTGDLASGALKGAAINGGKTLLQGGNLNDVLRSAATGAISGGTGVMAGGGVLGAGVSAGTNQALSNGLSSGGNDQVAAAGTQDTGLNTLYNNPNNLTTGQQNMTDFGSFDPGGEGMGGIDPNDPGQYGYGGTDPQGNYPGTTGTDDGLPEWLKQGQEMYKNLSPFIRQLLGLPSSGDPNKPDPYRFPYGNIVTAGLGVGGEMARQSSLQNTMGQVMNADKWNQEATRYWSPLYDAATKGIGNTAYGQSLADASARKMSSMGYNMSGNQMNDVAQSLNAGTTQYMGAVAPLAMGRAPDTRAMAPLGLGMAESKGNLFNALNYGAQSVLRGDQSTGIGQPRQTLPQIFGF